MLEQKVWLTTSSQLYPNLYVFLIGHPGVGKTRSVRAAKSLVQEIPEFHLAPTSMTSASLVDVIETSKRLIVRMPQEPLEYNTCAIFADELGTFMHKYDNEMVAVLSAFYDPDPYGQNRRGKDIKIKIKKPQLNILCGSTPSNLLEFMPEGAWNQGFTSRIILVFSDERIIGDDFAKVTSEMSPDLLYDLKIINSLCGEFKVTEDYRTCVNNWRQLGEVPVPQHPKLLHYNTRRRVHLYKLSMIAAINKSNTLILTRDDFNQAMNWLVEAEVHMPQIFSEGATNSEAQAIDEIYHFIRTNDRGAGLSEHKITNFARERIPLHSILNVISIMEKSGMIAVISEDKRTGLRTYKAMKPENLD